MRNLLPLFFGVLPALVNAQGTSLDFDGADDYVNVPNGSALIAGAPGFSIACWVYPRNTAPAYPDFDGMAGFRNEADCDFYLLQISPANTVEGRVRLSDFTVYTITSDELALNDWNHVALTYDGSELVMYHNGAAVASTTTTSAGITNATVPFEVGTVQFQFNQFLLDGKLDDIGLWSRALTASDVECLANGAIPLDDPAREVWFNCEQGTQNGNNTAITELANSDGAENGSLNNFALTGTTSNFTEGATYGLVVDGTTCPGVPYIYNSTPYGPGTYQFTVPGQFCDEFVTLTVQEIPLNTGVFQNGAILTCLNGGANWQWLDCTDGFAPIPGATFQTYTAPTNGQYAVQVTQGDCVDTSACYAVTSIGVSEQYGRLELHVSPTITDGTVLVSTSGLRNGQARIELIDASGRLVLRLANTGDRTALDIHDLPTGVYSLWVRTDSAMDLARVIKH